MIDDEWQAYYEQAWWFGRYYKMYFRLRNHFEYVLRNKTCANHCRQTTEWFLEDVGTRDERMLSLRMVEDGNFNAKLAEAGIAEADANTKIFESLMKASNEAVYALMKQYREAVNPSAGNPAPQAPPPEQDAVNAIAAGNLEHADPIAIKLEEVRMRALDPEIQFVMANAEKRAEITTSLRGIFSKSPLARAALFTAKHLPGGSRVTATVMNSTAIKWLFSRMRDTELNDNFSYELTRMNRNPQRTAEMVLSELRQMSARSTEEDPGGDAVFELVARRADLLTMWVEILQEVENSDKDPIKKLKYADLKPKIDRYRGVASRRETARALPDLSR